MRKLAGIVVIAAVVAVALEVMATTHPVAASSPTKILVVMEENHSLSQAEAGMPYLFGLARIHGYATDYSAVSHPSVPNYLAIASGSTHGITSDPDPGSKLHGQSVFDQALAAGKTAKTYNESMSGNCSINGTSAYDVNHNPWPYFSDEHANCMAHDVPSGTELSGALLTDVRAGALPNAGMLSPNNAHDAHDGTLKAADTWLQGWLPIIMGGPDYTSGRLILMVVFDEGCCTFPNDRVLAVDLSVTGGKVVTKLLDHYSLARAYEQITGTPFLSKAATAPDLLSAFGTAAATRGAPTLHVQGNKLVDQNGNAFRMLGVNRSGAEYACAEGWGIFDGPTDTAAAIAAMQRWHVNAVRLPLNEDCWLNINGVKAAYGGVNYQNAIVQYVDDLNAAGIVVILNLHFSAPGTILPDNQWPMADEDHSPAFWSSLARVFKDNHSVVFDLFNEPYPDSNRDTTAAWSCVLNGGRCAGVSYRTAGMQQMVDAVRATGATQPLLIAGPQYAGDLDRWRAYEPVDPLNQLVASVHIYEPRYAPCAGSTCWTTIMDPLAAVVPIEIGELGSINCTAASIMGLLNNADANGIGYTAWAWNVGSCSGEPSLITDYTGTPSRTYGQGFHDHMLAVT